MRMTWLDSDVTALDSVIDHLTGDTIAKSISTLTEEINSIVASPVGVASHLGSHGTLQMTTPATDPPGTVTLIATVYSKPDPA